MFKTAVIVVILLGLCSGQDVETTTELMVLTTQTEPKDQTTIAAQEETTTEAGNTESTTIDLEGIDHTELAFAPFGLPIEDDEPVTTIPFGVLQHTNGTSAKKRCRCIQKKRRKVLKEIRYIPLAPLIQLNGPKRNFTCKCSHLRKVPRN